MVNKLLHLNNPPKVEDNWFSKFAVGYVDELKAPFVSKWSRLLVPTILFAGVLLSCKSRLKIPTSTSGNVLFGFLTVVFILNLIFKQLAGLRSSDAES